MHAATILVAVKQRGFHLIWLGVEQGASKGSLQRREGVLRPCCLQADLLSPLPALGPHIPCLFFNFLLGKGFAGLLGCAIASQPCRDSSQFPLSPFLGPQSRGTPGGLRTPKSLPNLLSRGKQCFTHPDPSLLSLWSLDAKLRGP